MRWRAYVLAVMVCAGWVNAAEAFNGGRAGFVIGGGLGFCPYASWDVEETGGPSDHGAGGAFDFLIGYGWNRNNLLVFEADFAYYKTTIHGIDATAYQGYIGPSWYRYSGRPGRALFLTIGYAGYRFLYRYGSSNDLYGHGGGVAQRIGGGYEFARHFQAGVYLSTGLTFDADGFTYEHFTANIMVSGVAF